MPGSRRAPPVQREPWNSYSPQSPATPTARSTRRPQSSPLTPAGYRYGSSRGERQRDAPLPSPSPPKRSPRKQTAEELEAEVVDVMANSMLRMRGEVHWRHERLCREEKNVAIVETEKSLQDRLRKMEANLEHVAEVVYILRCTEHELVRMRRDEILSPNREPRSYRSFSSTRFSPTLPGETPRVGVSSRWGDAAEAAQDSDDFKEFVQQLNRLGHEYYERQVTEGAAAVDAECGQLVAAAEADGEEAWAVALSAVHEEWEEGGVRREDFQRFVEHAREKEDSVVSRYVSEQEASAAQFAQHECRAELSRVRAHFEADATNFYDRRLRAQAEADVETILAICRRSDAYRNSQASGCPGEHSASGRRGPKEDPPRLVSTEEANAISATSIVRARQLAECVHTGLRQMKQVEFETLDKCVRYVLLTEECRGSKVFMGKEHESPSGRRTVASDLSAAWGITGPASKSNRCGLRDDISLVNNKLH